MLMRPSLSWGKPSSNICETRDGPTPISSPNFFFDTVSVKSCP